MAEQWQQERKKNKQICILFGGLVEADDPARAACDILTKVFEELGFEVSFWVLTQKNPSEIFECLQKSCAVVIAHTVEWYGIGYPLQRFLDAAYLKKRDRLFEGLPLLSVIFSRRAFEQEAAQYLKKAWQLLGGFADLEATGVFRHAAEITQNKEAEQWIEKKAEQFFRYYIHQNYNWPNSAAVLDLGEAPLFVPEVQTDESRRAQENVLALSHKLKQKLEAKTKTTQQSLLELIPEKYNRKADGEYHFQIVISDNPLRNMAVLIKNDVIRVYEATEDLNLSITLEEEILRRILDQKLSFQKAFMLGQLTAKGEFQILYQLDEFFGE